MSDDSKDAAPPQAPSPDNAQTQAEPPYQILGQYVKDLSFENPNAPAIFGGGPAPATGVNVDVQTNQLGGRDVEVILTVEARAEQDGKLAYLLELSFAAIVRIGPVPKEALNPLLLIEVPRMLFPYAREIVSNSTRAGGFSMLLLAPFDFVALYRQRMGQLSDAAPGTASDAAAKPKLDS